MLQQVGVETEEQNPGTFLSQESICCDCPERRDGYQAEHCPYSYFQAMKDYIIKNQPLIEQHRYFKDDCRSHSRQISDYPKGYEKSYEALVMDHDEKFAEVIESLDDSVKKKSELSPIVLDFSRGRCSAGISVPRRPADEGRCRIYQHLRSSKDQELHCFTQSDHLQ